MRPIYYGCLSCHTAVLHHHGNGYCRDGYGASRLDCGQASSFQADGALDRYELAEATFIAPKDQSRWPLKMMVTQAQLYRAGDASAPSAPAQPATMCTNSCSNARDGDCDDDDAEGDDDYDDDRHHYHLKVAP